MRAAAPGSRAMPPACDRLFRNRPNVGERRTVLASRPVARRRRQVAKEPKTTSSAACSEVALAVVVSKAPFRFLEELEISVRYAANPSAFPILDLDELRRHAHRRHPDDDVETSPVADDGSDLEHGRCARATGCTTAPSATRPSAPIPRFARPRASRSRKSSWPRSELDATRDPPQRPTMRMTRPERATPGGFLGEPGRRAPPPARSGTWALLAPLG